MLSVTCPSCETIFKNATPSAEGVFRCLNCGVKFQSQSEGNAALKSVAVISKGSPAAAEKTHDLQASTYVLLSLWGSTLGILMIAGGGLTLISIGAQGFFNSFGRGIEILLGLIVGVGLILSGICVGFIFKLPNKMDKIALQFFRSLGFLPDAIEDFKGSNLPYLLPMTVVGATFLIAVMGVVAGREMLVSTLFLGPLGLVLFLGGLAMTDLRRFFWRMQSLAQAIPSDETAPKNSIPFRLYQKGNHANLLLLFGSLLALLNIFFLEGWTYQLESILVEIMIATAIAATCYSLHCNMRLGIRTLQLWEEKVGGLLIHRGMDFPEERGGLWRGFLEGLGYFVAFGALWSTVFGRALVFGWGFCIGLIILGLGMAVPLLYRALRLCLFFAEERKSTRVRERPLESLLLLPRNRMASICTTLSLITFAGLGMLVLQSGNRYRSNGELGFIYACFAFAFLWVVTVTSYAGRALEILGDLDTSALPKSKSAAEEESRSPL